MHKLGITPVNDRVMPGDKEALNTFRRKGELH